MPIDIHWANNTQSIVIQKFYDVWTWDQVSKTCRGELYPTITDIQQPIVLIQDMVGSHWTPTTSLLAEIEMVMSKRYRNSTNASEDPIESIRYLLDKGNKHHVNVGFMPH